MRNILELAKYHFDSMHEELVEGNSAEDLNECRKVFSRDLKRLERDFEGRTEFEKDRDIRRLAANIVVDNDLATAVKIKLLNILVTAADEGKIACNEEYGFCEVFIPLLKVMLGIK